MTSYGNLCRLGRLRGQSGKYLVAVLDDGLVSGAYIKPSVIQSIAKHAADSGAWCLMAYPGLFEIFIPSDLKVGRIINISASTTLQNVALKQLVVSSTTALQHGADAVTVHASFGVPGEGKMLRRLAQTIEKARGYGLPIIAATYARDLDGNPIQDAALQAHAARCAMELGADFIKAPWPGSVTGLEKMVAAVAPVPLLLAGGAVSSTLNSFDLARYAFQAGCSGLCFGRRLTSAKDPSRVMEQIEQLVSTSD